MGLFAPTSMTDASRGTGVLRCALVACLLMASAGVCAEPVVIVNPGADIERLDAKHIGAIFMRRDADHALEPFDQVHGNAIRKAFYEGVLNKTENQINAYWARLLFTGKGMPPKALDDDAAVKQRVASDVKAVGYIDSSALDDTVKLVYSGE